MTEFSMNDKYYFPISQVRKEKLRWRDQQTTRTQSELDSGGFLFVCFLVYIQALKIPHSHQTIWCDFLIRGLKGRKEGRRGGRKGKRVYSVSILSLYFSLISSHNDSTSSALLPRSLCISFSHLHFIHKVIPLVFVSISLILFLLIFSKQFRSHNIYPSPHKPFIVITSPWLGASHHFSNTECLNFFENPHVKM